MIRRKGVEAKNSKQKKERTRGVIAFSNALYFVGGFIFVFFGLRAYVVNFYESHVSYSSFRFLYDCFIYVVNPIIIVITAISIYKLKRVGRTLFVCLLPLTMFLHVLHAGARYVLENVDQSLSFQKALIHAEAMPIVSALYILILILMSPGFIFFARKESRDLFS